MKVQVRGEKQRSVEASEQRITCFKCRVTVVRKWRDVVCQDHWIVLYFLLFDHSDRPLDVSAEEKL